MKPDSSFEDLRKWLRDHGLLGRLRTQIAALVSADDAQPAGLVTTLRNSQADALASQALTETLGSAWTQLARFHPRNRS